jgi:adenine-specific DNA-methyltransferase
MERLSLMLGDAETQPLLIQREEREGFFAIAGEEEIHRSLGYVTTPPEVVEFIVRLAQPPRPNCDVLEPACGDARFLRRFEQAYGSTHRLAGVEINADVICRVHHTSCSHPGEGNYKGYPSIFHADFLLWDTSERFDIVLGNPPYGIVGDASHYPIHLFQTRKTEYKRRTVTWKGKYNLYGAFIEKAVRLLKPHGRLVFIVPTTWLILDDFSLLRRFLAERGRVEVFYVGRVFPKVNVSAVVLRFTLGGRGLALYDSSALGTACVEPVLSDPDYTGDLIRFETDEWRAFERSGTPIRELFHIRVAARSSEFRRSGLIRPEPGAGYVPVLTGRNLLAGRIDYETCYSGWWMRPGDAPRLRRFYAEPHLVVGHTKGVRLLCAVDWRCYPWREEYHLMPRDGVQVDWVSLQRYLNGEQVQAYLQALYRDFTPHLTRTMLERIPVPERIVRCPLAPESGLDSG